MARIAVRGAICNYPRSAILQTEGTPGDSLCFIISGRLKVYVGGELGREVLLDTLAPGDCVGLASIDGGRRAVSVKALTPVKVCILDQSEVATLIARDRGFTKYLLTRLVRRVRTLTSAVQALALQDVHTRVVGLLLGFARYEGSSRIVRPRLSQREIADRVGASPGMVSKVIKDLVARGRITVKSSAIVVDKALTAPMGANHRGFE